MFVQLAKVLVIVLLIMSTTIGAAGADAAKKTITVAILPCYDIVMTFKKFHPLIAYLEEETGYKIRMTIQTNFSEFELAVRNGGIDFALQDPHTYVILADLYNQDALLGTLTPEGTTSHRGAVIVRRDSGFKNVTELKGKTIMFGPKQSIAKWVAAKILFEENGIDIEEDLRAYSNGKCCEDIAFNVYLEAVDAGLVCSHFIEEYSDEEELGMDIGQITIIAETDLVPTRVFTARKELDKEIVSKVVHVLLGLDSSNPEHAKMMRRAELGGFRVVRDEEYDSIRKLVGTER